MQTQVIKIPIPKHILKSKKLKKIKNYKVAIQDDNLVFSKEVVKKSISKNFKSLDDFLLNSIGTYGKAGDKKLYKNIDTYIYR